MLVLMGGLNEISCGFNGWKKTLSTSTSVEYIGVFFCSLERPWKSISRIFSFNLSTQALVGKKIIQVVVEGSRPGEQGSDKRIVQKLQQVCIVFH